MKKTITTLIVVCTLALKGQVFYGGTGSILSNGGQETNFSASVSGLPSKIDSTFGLVEVSLTLTHPEVKELHIVLKSPWGAEVDLTGVLTLKGPNFVNTIFNSNTPQSITTALSPYTGTFRPVGYLGRFNTGKSPNGTWKLEVKDFVLANSGTVDSWSLKFGQSPPKPVVLQSSNLPLVILNTNNQALSDVDIVATLGIIDNGPNRNHITDPWNNYNGKASVHIRGSSSKMFEKNNLKVELKDNSGVMDVEASLLGMPAESDWVLTAFYNDKSLLRNPLTHHLFSKMDRYAPRFRYVELVLNGEYYGIYILMEQPKRGGDRVNVAKMTPFDNSFPQITGGYIIQINRSDDPGWYSLNPGISNNGAKFYYQYNYPKDDEITTQQKDYIKAVLDSFETAMASPNFADSKTGYHKFIDEGSFIDFMIINEMSKNVDAYKLSTYLYKHNIMDGGKIFIGPTWDYDLAWHNSDFGNAWNELYWQYEQNNNEYPIPTWWTRFMESQAFKDRLYCRYHTLRKSTLSNNKIYEFIDATVDLLSEAQVRNFRQFPLIGTYVYGNPQSPQQEMTYEKEIQDLKDWVFKRSQWLDQNVPGFCQDVAVNDLKSGDLAVSAYPNPFGDYLHLMYNLDRNCTKVTLRVLDITGAQTMRPVEGGHAAGEHRMKFNCSGLPAGAYILELNVDGSRYYSKMVKTETQ